MVEVEFVNVAFVATNALIKADATLSDDTYSDVEVPLSANRLVI